MSKSWQVWLVLGGIFAFGGVCGAIAGFRIGREGHRHAPPPRDWVLRRMDRIGQELGLTPEQKARIRPIVQRHIDELMKSWRQSIAASREVIDRMQREIAAELTPEQRAHLEKFLQERREHVRSEWRERQTRGDPDLPPEPPPWGPPPPPPPGSPAPKPADAP